MSTLWDGYPWGFEALKGSSRVLSNFDQFICHMSQSHLMKQNLVTVTGHHAT
jgi:hypothetical protein